MPAKDRRHYRGSYPKRAKLVRVAAYANPLTRCWRCGRTLAEHQAEHPERVVKWQAGHTADQDSSRPLAPEVDCCNAAAGNRARRVAELGPLNVSRRWY